MVNKRPEQIRLVWRKIDELIPYEHNAKLHPKEQLDKLVGSFDEFGRIVPAGIDAQGNLIYGHGRILAARQRGDTEFPCIEIEGLSETQRRAFVHADNLLSQSGTDEDVLRAEMQALRAAGFDVAITGFDPAGLVIGEDDETAPEIREDDYDGDVPEEPRTKRGQIWQLGRHRLMCGDSTSAEDVAELMGGRHINLVLTDPPYGISVVQGSKVGGGGPLHFGKVGGGKIVESTTYMEIKGDDTTDTARDNYGIIREMSDNQIIFGGNYFTDFLPPSRCWVVWDKQNTGNFADAELAWTSFDRGVKLYRFMWNGLVREGDRKTEGVHRVHPTQKPVGLIGNILNDFSQDGDTVLDCFGGSGSTLIACEQAGRDCFMMEYQPEYIDVIINRWETFTGKKAVLLDG